jgi:hypothetical protein
MKISAFQKGLLITLILFIFLGGTLLVTRLIMADAFSKEEAQHALYGLHLYKDIRALDWGAFWYDTNRQVFWPFFHSWIQALFFLVLGVSAFSARFLSFVIFFATLIMIYAVCARFSQKSGWQIGLIAVTMALTSPMMTRYAVENGLEGLGALIFLSTFYVYSIYEERKLTYEYVLLAALLGLSIYTNYLYAYLILPAFIVMSLGKLGPLIVQISSLRRKGEKAALDFLWWAYRKLIVLIVLTILVAAWFFTNTFSRKILLLLQAIFRYSGGEQVGGLWNNISYYPKAIINSYTFSPWLGLLIFASLFLPFLGLKYRHFGKLYTFIWTALILLTLTIQTKAPQFIYIIAPFLLIVFSIAVSYFTENARKFGPVVLLAIFLPSLLSAPRLVSLYLPERPRESMVDVLDYFQRQLLPRNPIASSVNLQHLNSEGIAFRFWDWNAPVLADPAVGPDEMFNSAKYFMTVSLDSASPYGNEILDDNIFLWNAFLSEKQRLGEIREFGARRFETIGVTAAIYEKKEDSR